MSFLRPGARAAIYRWREVLIAVALILLGLYWAMTWFGVMRWVGGATVLAGIAFGWAGAQRARFQGGHGGVGVVDVTERQITYLAPLGGGMAAIDALTEVSIAPDSSGMPLWRLKSGYELLSIPAQAEGAERLFDVFNVLPGLDIEQAIRLSQAAPDALVVLWRREAPHLVHIGTTRPPIDTGS